ncbi:MAG: D-alanyl-D-alanine carboxypeptidase, partial [Oscillospiraceae bacterium]|nr:D-alanyl-D-alanine carboxypeptidase [Oscillospiraceae bacterium]
GRTFYCVVLGTEDEESTGHKFSFSESKRLLEWAFDNFHRITLLDQETENVLREVAVTLSDEADYVMAQPVGKIEATMPSDYDPKRAELLVDLPESIEAPVAAGDKLGTITFQYDGVTYGTLDMVAMDSVERSNFLYTIQQIQEYWGKWWVKALAATGVVLALTLVFFLTVVLPKRKARRRYSRGGSRRVGAGGYRGRR